MIAPVLLSGSRGYLANGLAVLSPRSGDRGARSMYQAQDEPTSINAVPRQSRRTGPQREMNEILQTLPVQKPPHVRARSTCRNNIPKATNEITAAIDVWRGPLQTFQNGLASRS